MKSHATQPKNTHHWFIPSANQRSTQITRSFPGSASSKEPACQCRLDVRYMDSIPGSRRSPGGGHGNPLQYSCLENPMDRGAWWATVHGVAESGNMTEVTYHTRRPITRERSRRKAQQRICRSREDTEKGTLCLRCPASGLDQCQGESTSLTLAAFTAVFGMLCTPTRQSKPS